MSFDSWYTKPRSLSLTRRLQTSLRWWKSSLRWPNEWNAALADAWSVTSHNADWTATQHDINLHTCLQCILALPRKSMSNRAEEQETLLTAVLVATQETPVTGAAARHWALQAAAWAVGHWLSYCALKRSLRFREPTDSISFPTPLHHRISHLTLPLNCVIRRGTQRQTQTRGRHHKWTGDGARRTFPRGRL